MLHEPEFNHFLKENTAFWREHTGFPQDSERRIYVDLAHDNSAYLLINLWIAKYLQRFKPAKVIGLGSAWPKPCPNYSFDLVKRLGDSFLLDDVVDLDCPEHDDIDLTASFAHRVDGLKGAELRNAVLTFAGDVEEHLGWILYDTWLRQEARGTLEASTPDLIACASRVFKARRAVKAAMAYGTTVAAVVGHYHYNPYAWIAVEAVRQNAPAFFQSILHPVSIRRFATESDFRRGRAADFLSEYERLVSRTVEPETLKSFERRMFDIQRVTRQFFQSTPHTDKVRPRKLVLRELGLRPDQPVVGLFVPALCGPAHCFGDIFFDDNGDWLKKCLDIAVRTSSVNYLVKRHPQDSIYDVGDLVGRCEGMYGGSSNIRFLSGDLPLNQVAELCDVAVTVSGTPGYELPARGVASIACGPSRYSDLGFSREPATYSDFTALLQNPSDISMDAEQQRKAICFFFFEMAAGRSQAIFVPPPSLAGTAEFWNEAVRHLRSKLPEEDPLFRNLRHMIANDLPFLLNTDLVDTRTAQAQPAAQRPATDSLLAGLHAVSLTAVRLLEDRNDIAEREITRMTAERNSARNLIASWIDEGHHVKLGRGHWGLSFLVSGWSYPEDGGIWSDGASATIAFPSLNSASTLCIECYGYLSPDSPVRLVSALHDGISIAEQEFQQSSESRIWRMPVVSRDELVEVVVRIERPVSPPGDPRRLGIWVAQFWLEPRD